MTQGAQDCAGAARAVAGSGVRLRGVEGWGQEGLEGGEDGVENGGGAGLLACGAWREGGGRGAGRAGAAGASAAGEGGDVGRKQVGLCGEEGVKAAKEGVATVGPVGQTLGVATVGPVGHTGHTAVRAVMAKMARSQRLTTVPAAMASAPVLKINAS
jgi:hypothetical protein